MEKTAVKTRVKLLSVLPALRLCTVALPGMVWAEALPMAAQECVVPYRLADSADGAEYPNPEIIEAIQDSQRG